MRVLLGVASVGILQFVAMLKIVQMLVPAAGLRRIVLMVVVVIVVVRAMVMSMRVPLFLLRLVHMHSTAVNGKPHPLDVLPFSPLKVHVEIADLQLAQLPFEGGRLHPQVAQRAYHHIAGDAGEAVEEQGFHKSHFTHAATASGSGRALS